MTPTLTLDADGLALHHVRTHADANGLRPRRFRLDSEGIALAVELPGPDYLATFVRLGDLDAYRSGSAILARPAGSNEEPEAVALADVHSALWQALAALPERPDAGLAYRDLRLAAGTRSAVFGEYLLDVVRAYRRSLPAVPKRPKARGTAARSAAERARDSRARLLADEEASALEWLRVWLDPEDPPALGRTLLAEIYAEAAAAIADWRDDGETLDNGRPFRVPGPRVFARVFAVRLGHLSPITRTKHGRAVEITPEHLSPATAVLLTHAAEHLADTARHEILAALSLTTRHLQEVAL